MGSQWKLTQSYAAASVLITITLAGSYCQEWTPLVGGRNSRTGGRNPLAVSSIPLTGGSIPPPSLADDTLVNRLLSEKRRTGGLRQVDRNTELVTEHPPGSGRVLPVKSGSEFTPTNIH